MSDTINKKEPVSKNKRQYYIDYFEKNKDELKEKITCTDCGVQYMKYNKTRHLNTRKHERTILINKIDRMTNELDEIKKYLLKDS